MSGISCASLEPPTEEILNDSTLKQRNSGDTKKQSGEAVSELPETEVISDNETCDETQKLERIGMYFPESNNRVVETDDSSPIINQDGESCIPNPEPLLRCPYLDEVSDSSSRYIVNIYILSSVKSHKKQPLLPAALVTCFLQLSGCALREEAF